MKLMKEITLILILTLVSGIFFTFAVEAEKLTENKENYFAAIETRCDVKIKVYLNDNKLDQEQELKVKIEILNNSKDDLILKFNSSQKYNIKLINSSNKTIYSWEKEKIFSQALQEIKIEGKDSLIFREKIDLNQFSAEEYSLEVYFLAKNYNFDIIKKEFKIFENK